MSDIEYFYSAHSAFAYIGARRLAEICAATGRRLVHRPIFLSPVVEATGAQPFAARPDPHIDYFFDVALQRWARYRDMPIIDFRPTHHDNPLDLPNGMIIVAAETGADVDALATAILTAHWVEDANIADADRLAQIAAGVEIDGAPLLDAALSAPIQDIHKAYTAEATARSVFGSPTYFVEGEMFYGQDQLDVMEWRISQL